MLILRSKIPYVQFLSFSFDAATLYASHGYRGLWTWNLADRTASKTVFAGETMIHGFESLPGGRWALGQATGGLPPRYNPLRLIDLPADTSRPFQLMPACGVAAAPDGGQVVGIGHSHYDEDRPAEKPCQRLYGFALTVDGPLYRWHADVPASAYTRGIVRLGPERFATVELAVPVGFVLNSNTRRMRTTICRATSGELEATLDYPHPQMHQLLAAPDGSTVVARLGMELHVWDATDWKRPPLVVEGKHKHTMNEPAAAFDPSGHYLLLANDGPSVIVYDTTTWKPVRKWKWDVGVLRAVAVAPDGSMAAAAGPRGAIAVWDLDL